MNKWSRLIDLDKFVDWLVGFVGVLSLMALVLGGVSKIGNNEADLSWWELIFLAAFFLVSMRYFIVSRYLESLQRVNHLLRSDVDILTSVQVDFEKRWLGNIRVTGAFDESAEAWQSLEEEALRLGYGRDPDWIGWSASADKELEEWAEDMADDAETLADMEPPRSCSP